MRTKMTPAIERYFFWPRQIVRAKLWLAWLLSGIGGRAKFAEDFCVSDESALAIKIGGRLAGCLFYGYCGPGRENQYGFTWNDAYIQKRDCGERLFQSRSILGIARELRAEVME